jgi:predicted acyltransferase
MHRRGVHLSATLTPESARRVAATAAASVTSARSAPAERLLSLDVFRGMTVAGMLLVNNPGSWAHIFPPLEHAKWHGWTPTDLIFPFFLFIVGVTAHLSLSSRRARGDGDGAIMRQVFRRAALIFLFGLTLTWFPGYQWGSIASLPDASFMDRVVYRLEHLRVMGVLQRIGVAYLLAMLLTLRGSWRQHLVVLAGVLLGYWALMTLVVVPDRGVPGSQLLDDPGGVLSAWLDRQIIGLDHLWSGGKTWDPEGVLSSVPAAGTVMLGQFAGRWIGASERPLAARLNGLFAVGALLMMVGLMWHWVFPINKSLWTSSYVVFTGGLAAVTLATCMWVIDVQGWRRWSRFFEIYGTNPMIAFLGSGIMARLTVSILKVETPTGARAVSAVTHEALFASWLPSKVASLAYAVSFVLVWFVILRVLWQRKIFLKV